MPLRAHTTHPFKSKPSYTEVWALSVLARPLPRTAGIFVFDVHKMLRFRFYQSQNLLGRTSVLHGICSVFVLSDHRWFSSFFPVEFATPAAVAVLGATSLHRL